MRGNMRGSAAVIQYMDWDTGEPAPPAPAAPDFHCVLITRSNAGSGNWVVHDCNEAHLFVCAKG